MAISKQNLISVDEQTAVSSYGEFFSVGEEVMHEGAETEVGTIKRFEADKETNEVVVHTSRGTAHLDFLIKINGK